MTVWYVATCNDRVYQFRNVAGRHIWMQMHQAAKPDHHDYWLAETSKREH